MIFNKTPHPISVYQGLGRGQYELIETFEPDHPPARLKIERRRLNGNASINLKGYEIPLNEWAVTVKGDAGLPPQAPGVWYIVSRVVAEKLPHRSDLLVVDETVRDNATGDVIGCQAFSIVN